MSPRETDPMPEEVTPDPEKQMIDEVVKRIRQDKAWRAGDTAYTEEMLKETIKVRDMSAEKVSSPDRAAEIVNLADRIAREIVTESSEQAEPRVVITNFFQENDVTPDFVRERFPEVADWSDGDIEALAQQIGKYGSNEFIRPRG